MCVFTIARLVDHHNLSPVVLGGDFNATDSSPLILEFMAGTYPFCSLTSPFQLSLMSVPVFISWWIFRRSSM
jgi:hypothetical protein